MAGVLPASRQLPSAPKNAEVAAQRVVGARAGEDRRIHRGERGEAHDEREHASRPCRRDHDAHDVGRDRLRLLHAAEAERGEVGRGSPAGRATVTARMPPTRMRIMLRRASRTSPDEVGRLVPAAEGEQHEDHRQAERAAAGWRRRAGFAGAAGDQAGDARKPRPANSRISMTFCSASTATRAGDVQRRERDDAERGLDRRAVFAEAREFRRHSRRTRTPPRRSRRSGSRSCAPRRRRTPRRAPGRATGMRTRRRSPGWRDASSA